MIEKGRRGGGRAVATVGESVGKENIVEEGGREEAVRERGEGRGLPAAALDRGR